MRSKSVLAVVYPGCSAKIFSAFICDPLEDGTSVLRVDYSVTCYENEYWPIFLYALLMVIVYPIGTPVLYAVFLYRSDSQLKEIQRDEDDIQICELQQRQLATLANLREEGEHLVNAKRKAHTGKEKISIEARLTVKINRMKKKDAWIKKQDELTKKKAGIVEKRKGLDPAVAKLTAAYQMHYCWFEIFECFRKIMTVGLPVFMVPGSSGQLMFGLLVTFISFGMYAKFAPFIHDSDDRLQQVCQISLFFALASGIVLKMEVDSSYEVLTHLLTVMLCVPPVLAFFFESDFDFSGLKELMQCFRLNSARVTPEPAPRGRAVSLPSRPAPELPPMPVVRVYHEAAATASATAVAMVRSSKPPLPPLATSKSYGTPVCSLQRTSSWVSDGVASPRRIAPKL